MQRPTDSDEKKEGRERTLPPPPHYTLLSTTTSMLYDTDTSLSADTQSSCDTEQIVAQQLRELSLAKPSAQLDDKQRFIHFLQDKVRNTHNEAQAACEEERG